MRNAKLVGIFTLCALLTIGTAALAQGGRPGGRGGGPGGGPGGGGAPALPDSAQVVQMVDEMGEAISLSDDQKAQITELHLAHFEDVRAMMSNRSGDRDAMRTKMQALREGFDSDVKALLDEDQQEAYDEYQKARRPARGQRGQRRR